MGPSDASGPRDTQALLSTAPTMEIHVERPLLNQEQLEQLGHWGPAPRTYQWRTWFQCSRSRAHGLLLKYLPVLGWLPHYRVREWLLGDLLSGLSVAIMQLPQGLAYALLAGLPPVFGLYSSFYPVFVYFLFGTSRHISVGTFAIMSVMVGSLTESMVPEEDVQQGLNSTVENSTSSDHVQQATQNARVELAFTLSVLVGLFQVALGLVQFGFVVTYLSEPLVRGYTTAASIQVLVSQLKYVFGLQLGRSRSGPLSLVKTFVEVCRKLPETVVGTMVTAIVAGVALLMVKILNDKLHQHLPLPIPGELLTLIVATGISYGVNLNKTFGVDIVGTIPAGLVPPKAPNPQLFARLVGNAFAIAVVGFAIAISLGKIFALRHGYRVDSNQELVALGLSNFIGGLFQCFPVSCSMSRSLVQETTGGNTQVAGAVSSLFILIIILKLGELFQDLPKAKEVPGVKVFRSSATLYFANAELYSDALKQRCGVDVEHLLAQKKKRLRRQERRLKRQQKEQQKQQQKQQRKAKQAASPNGTSISVAVDASLGDLKGRDVEDSRAKVSPANAQEDVAAGGQEEARAPEASTLKALGLPRPDFHSLVLDLGALSFVDTVCIKSLKNIFRDFREIEVEVYIAACHSPVVTQLEAGHFFDASITKQHVFVSVHDAVTFALQHSRSGPSSPVLATKL
ncbi:PREDICTED: solute carrier family 26 member 6 isoform X5 [Chinchilla lanigera]|uniref:solute carrier family 26 member 6 isoform X5 n=1 Tax=Chinchilla lanigera TaxID=34839 RepID=UPI000698DC2D|nr:PREDICTED: solute carrier family 26 member 6 isoform X5 [Chinchilla lanigera]